MVQLACSCLNTRLHTQQTPDTLVPGLPSLSPRESQHPFFTKGVYLVTLGLGGVTEAQNFLVRRFHVGGWTLHECLNCHLLTHATNPTTGEVAASTSLISDPSKIQMLQKCDGYSPAFSLVLPTSLDNRPLPPLSPTDFSNERSPETEESLKAIQEQTAKFLKKAEQQVEGNIRQYTDQQHKALHACQTRVRRDRQTLMRLLSTVQANRQSREEAMNPLAAMEMDGARGILELDDELKDLAGGIQEEDDQFDDMVDDEPDVALPPLVSLQSRSSQPMSMNPLHGITGGLRNMRLSSSVSVPRARPQGNVRVAQSLDVEGLFDMEDMIANNVVPAQSNYHSDEDDTDDSNHDEGIHIPGSRVAVRDLAQSVPVTVPMWPGTRAKMPEEPQAIERPSDTQQMAASIKALARSVHSTSVDLFGDLPRPRQPY